jgi:hypothetical protein
VLQELIHHDADGYQLSRGAKQEEPAQARQGADLRSVSNKYDTNTVSNKYDTNRGGARVLE